MLKQIKTVIITGADRGLGRDTAEIFVINGYNVCICSRNENALKGVAEALNENRVDSEQRVVYKRTDIGEIEDVDSLYDFAVKECGTPDVIVNNAGIYGPIGSTDVIDWEDMEQVVRINLMGTLYSMRKAVHLFKSKGIQGRIINLSGGGATKGIPNFMGYSITKAAVVRATETMAEEVREYGISINAIAPGALNTYMLQEALAAGEEAVGARFYQQLIQQKKNGGASLRNAAELIYYLANEASPKVTGRLFSAVWDAWRDINIHADEIEKSDVYTLRRIIPRERGMDWE